MQILGISRWRSLLACFLGCSLISHASVIVQLQVVEGEGAVYRIGSRADHGLTVLVTDEAGKPVPSAAVSFRLPESGPTGVFSTGLRTEIVNTGADGRASVKAVQWNKTPGTVEIRITAVKDQARAGLIATQKLADAAVSHGSTASRDYSVSTPQIISPRELAMVGEKSPVQEKPLRASAAADATPPAPAPRDLAAPRESAVAPKVAATPTSSAATHDLATPRSAAAPAETAAPREANALRDAATPQAGGQGVFKASHSGKGKWILLGVLAGGGAAAGMALGRSHAASSATTPPAGLSIGTPSITVGAHP